jgi:cold shock CspA family protein
VSVAPFTVPPSSGLAAAFGTRIGRVASFDEAAGRGTVASDDTGEQWFFHCTRIGDGSRSIPEGTWVAFEVVPGPTGLEAVGVRRRG